MIKQIKNPVRIAVIGAGNRSSTIYMPLFEDVKPWIEIAAVCDPIKEHADNMAKQTGAKAFYDIHDLVENCGIEAALVITPGDSHHSISVFLSEHKIHNMVETTWCNTQRQADEMITAAKKNGVHAFVAENFFRFAIDRFSEAVRENGYIGDIHRIYSYNDHTGYHNNSRWIHFCKSHPLQVQSVCHKIPTISFVAPPARPYESENFKSRFFLFPGDFMVIDNASNIKGFLGRQSRPGHTEWQGESGTLTHRGLDGWAWETTLRKMKPNMSTSVSPVIYETPGERFTRAYAETPEGIIEYINPYVPKNICNHINKPFYGCAVMDELIDFALAVRGEKIFECSAEDAKMSLTMDLAAEQSALEDGRIIKITPGMTFDIETRIEENLRKQYNTDPYDIEGMLAISYPRK